MRRDEITGAPLSPTSSRSRGDTASTFYPAYEPPTACRAIVPYVPPMPSLVPPSDSGNQTVFSFPEGGIAAEISVETPAINQDDLGDLEAMTDDEVSTGSGFVYDEEEESYLYSEKYGQKRQRMEKEKNRTGWNLNCRGGEGVDSQR